jgi:Spy/CpxP family protein refolding chaperone
MGGYGGPGAGIERMARRLDLSGKQLASVRAVEDKNRPQLRSLRDQMAANHQHLRQLAKQQTLDTGKLRSVADDQGKAIADMIVLRAEMRAEIDKILTDKQRDKLHHMHGKGKWGYDKD